MGRLSGEMLLCCCVVRLPKQTEILAAVSLQRAYTFINRVKLSKNLHVVASWSIIKNISAFTGNETLREE